MNLQSISNAISEKLELFTLLILVPGYLVGIANCS